MLTTRFASEASKHMAKAEIIELHHDGKLRCAQWHGGTHRPADGAGSGGEPPPIHSVRYCPVSSPIRRSSSAILTRHSPIRHDTTSRESFIPGVLLAIREVGTLRSSLMVGLEQLLFGVG